MQNTYTNTIKDSLILAKRFATLIRSYIKTPELVCSESSPVPLENFFRMLEMLRYDAFQDGATADNSWGPPLKSALIHAVSYAYPKTSQTDSINELQAVLRSISKNKMLPEHMLTRADTFFEAFEVCISQKL